MIEVNSYARGESVYVGLVHMEDGQMESFADLTINIPFSDLEINEAYISDFAVNSKLKFIEEHKLGTILPDTVSSGYAIYHKVVFDLDRLAELDPKGMEDFRRINGISMQEQEKTKRKGR